MKRKTSENNENDRETKRQRLIDSAIDIQYLFDYLPVEIWVDHIIPYCAKDWICVSKEWHDLAIGNLFKYTRSFKCMHISTFCRKLCSHGHLRTLKSILHYYNVPCKEEHFEVAVKKNQPKILKVLIKQEYGDIYISVDRLFKSIVWSCDVYNPQMLLYILTNFSLTVSAKEYILYESDPEVNLFELLLSDPDVDPFIENNHILETVAAHGLNDMTIKLLSDDRVDLEDSESMNTLTTNIAAYCNLEVFKFLLARFKHYTVAHLRVALKYSAMYDNTDTLQYLLSMQTLTQKDLKGVLSDACRFAKSDSTVKLLLDDPRVDPRESNNLPIRYATRERKQSIVESLLQNKGVDPTVNDNVVLKTAIENNDLQIVQLLLNEARLEKVDHLDQAKNAAACGSLQVLSWMLNTYSIDPSSDDDEQSGSLLETAIMYRQLDVVKFLIEDLNVDPSVNFNRAILIAKDRNAIQIINYLLEDSRVNPLNLDKETFLNKAEEEWAKVI
jgi:hypothetical protein